MPLVRVRIYLGQKLVAEPARPFSSGDSIRAIIDEALLPFGVELELKAVDVFKDAAEKIRTAQLPIAHLGGVTAGELVASDYGTNLVAHVQKRKHHSRSAMAVQRGRRVAAGHQIFQTFRRE